MLLAICSVIWSCAKLPFQQAILEEVYTNEIDPFQIRNDQVKEHLIQLSKKWPPLITRKKQKDLADYITYTENQKKLNILNAAPCKINVIQGKPLPDYNPISPIVFNDPSSPAMRNQIEIANKSNEQSNRQRIEERHLREYQIEMDVQNNVRTELQKCKTDSTLAIIKIKRLQLENYLKLQVTGNQIKSHFSRANRKLLIKKN